MGNRNTEYNTLEDLVFSISFRNWVLRDDAPEAGFWESWVARYPEKKGLIQHAKAIIYALQPNCLDQISDEEIDTAVRKILGKLEENPVDQQSHVTKKFRWMAAACLLVAAGFATLYYSGKKRDVFHSFLADHKNIPLHEQTAAPDSARTIDLPDGSRVLVAKGSHLYYAKDISTGSRREVFLSGEAFFEIRKDAARPFYVYTSQVITKVLGTSFRIKAFPSEEKTIVIVRTGKISVYRKEDFYRGGKGNEPGGIVVTPNQEMVYDQEKDQLNKVLTEEPQRITETRDSSFAFDATPVSKVFKRLQEVYGIPILYDEETVATCSLSASLISGSFYDKLNVICKAINASYEAIDGNIVVTARGCK